MTEKEKLPSEQVSMLTVVPVLQVLVLFWLAQTIGGSVFPYHSSLLLRQSQPSPVEEIRNEFNPYSDNGGTIMGIAGKHYVLIATDTRLSESYFIRSRNITRIFEVGDGVLMTASGCWADIVSLAERLRCKDSMFRWEHKQHLRVDGFSSLLSSSLYERRRFPYFSFCLLGGIDANGMGALYHYDAVGSKERVRATCAGKGEQLMQAFLDELTDMERDDGLWNFSSDGSEFTSSIDVITSLSREDAISVAIKAFKAAAEREISIGDGVHIVVISKVSNEDEEFSIESQIVPLPAH